MIVCYIKKLIAIGTILFLGAMSTTAIAGAIDSKSAIKILIGKTWVGKNERGDDYWFWHEQGQSAGKFGAKFKKPTQAASIHHGQWELEGNRLCWHWPDWNKTFCYVKFEFDGGKLDMTRSDGQVHSGTFVDGNTEGL